MKTKEPCSECGLTFVDGKRTFSTFGGPVVTVEQHLAYHAEERGRQLELRRAMKAQNALPLVEGHQPTEALCEERCRQAEVQSDIRLPVVVPSRTTMVRQSENAILWEEIPRATPSKLARHRRVYGSEGMAYIPEDGTLPALRSRKPPRRRAASRGKDSSVA